MENLDRLIQFIDRNTEFGTQELAEIFGEGVGVEDPGVEKRRRHSHNSFRIAMSLYWKW